MDLRKIEMMCSLLVLAAVAGCGGSSEDGDTVAPVLSFTVPVTAEGGENIPITVSITDNVDTNLTPTLSCSGGTLTGNILRAPEVTQNTTITCTATARDAAGNNGTASASITITAAARAITAASWATEATPGMMGILLAENVVLDRESYDGSFQGKTVKLFRFNGNQLYYVMPLDAPVGAGKLTFEVGGRSFAVDVTVAAGASVGNARDTLAQSFAAYRDTVSDLINAAGTSASDRTRLQDQLGKTNAAIAQLSTLSDEQAAGLAAFLIANRLVPTSSVMAAAYNPITGGENCLPRLKTFGRDAGLFILGAGVVTGAVSVATAVAAAAPYLVIPDIIFSGVGIAAGSYLTVTYGRRMFQSFPAARSACWTEVSIDLLPTELFTTSRSSSYIRATAVVAKQGFQQSKARAFKVQRQFAPLAAFRAEITKSIDELSSALSAVSFLPDDIRSTLGDVRTEGTEDVPVDRLALGGISRSDIQGQFARSGDAIVLTFKKTDPDISENINFSFSLTRSGEPPIEVPAQLVIQLPEADDAAVKVIQNQTVTSSVTTRGATSLEIVTQPTNGTVTLNNQGAFEYKPQAGFFGTDKFTYRAKNDVGPSTPATVVIDVERKFDGVWQISTRSTTLNETSPGLCPPEQGSFSLTISKVSDTQYTASYFGYVINLTMSSKDDPAGLSGSRTVTYDDDPGQTTETVTVHIPNSTTLTGQSAFTYSGPGNSGCSGRTDITGGR